MVLDRFGATEKQWEGRTTFSVLVETADESFWGVRVIPNASNLL